MYHFHHKNNEATATSAAVVRPLASGLRKWGESPVAKNNNKFVTMQNGTGEMWNQYRVEEGYIMGLGIGISAVSELFNH